MQNNLAFGCDGKRKFVCHTSSNLDHDSSLVQKQFIMYTIAATLV